MPLADVDQPIPDLPIPDLVAALDLSAAELGPFHPQTIVVVNRLAMAFWKAGDLQYCAVSDTGWDELLGLERLLQELGARDTR